MAEIHTLAIDIGGTGLKASVLDATGNMVVPRVKVPTPYPNTPRIMLDALTTLVAPLPAFEASCVTASSSPPRISAIAGTIFR